MDQKYTIILFALLLILIFNVYWTEYQSKYHPFIPLRNFQALQYYFNVNKFTGSWTSSKSTPSPLLSRQQGRVQLRIHQEGVLEGQSPFSQKWSVFAQFLDPLY